MSDKRMNLLNLAFKHGTDKEQAHGYISGCYERFFEPIRDEPIELLEIGVFCGASMRMWREYFPNAVLTGIDEVPAELYRTGGRHKFLHPGGGRAFEAMVSPLPESVRYIEADAYADETLAQLGLFDVIIDDGPHTHESQLAFAEKYWSKVKPGGLLMLEDIMAMKTVAALRELRKPDYMMDRSYTKTPDSRLMVWRKPEEVVT